MSQMQSHAGSALKIEDFGKLQERYQAKGLADRAHMALEDGEPALQMAEKILTQIAAHPKAKAVFEAMRKNAILTGKMRPSEAKAMLLDPGNDFIEVTNHKLQSWRKTMQRVAGGEGITKQNGREYIPSHAPIALSVAGISAVSGYLSIVQIALGELGKLDTAKGNDFSMDVARVRRCATLLSDCELASSITALVN